MARAFGGSISAASRIPKIFVVLTREMCPTPCVGSSRHVVIVIQHNPEPIKTKIRCDRRFRPKAALQTKAPADSSRRFIPPIHPAEALAEAEALAKADFFAIQSGENPRIALIAPAIFAGLPPAGHLRPSRSSGSKGALRRSDMGMWGANIEAGKAAATDQAEGGNPRPSTRKASRFLKAALDFHPLIHLAACSISRCVGCISTRSSTCFLPSFLWKSRISAAHDAQRGEGTARCGNVTFLLEAGRAFADPRKRPGIHVGVHPDRAKGLSVCVPNGHRSGAAPPAIPGTINERIHRNHATLSFPSPAEKRVLARGQRLDLASGLSSLAPQPDGLASRRFHVCNICQAAWYNKRVFQFREKYAGPGGKSPAQPGARKYRVSVRLKIAPEGGTPNENPRRLFPHSPKNQPTTKNTGAEKFLEPIDRIHF
jgi:hypothetical protein